MVYLIGLVLLEHWNAHILKFALDLNCCELELSFPELNAGNCELNFPELNTGQLLKLVREAFLVDARGINKVSGEPFTAQELTDKIEEKINE